jgi:alpha-L-fucosidase
MGVQVSEREARWQRTEWFRRERFGMFIHWGIYAIPGRGEWVKSVERIPTDEYRKYFQEFDPDLYDPRAWARAAKNAGMRYAVMTAKHHDGFCLFDSALTDFKATNTKAGRDLTREYVEAFRAEGLKVGIYYSLIDWNHPDYPHFGDRTHPMRENEACRGTQHRFERYVEYLHGQVREICSNYGVIDILWFDFSYDTMTGETWRAADLVKMVRSLQPGVILDNRLNGHTTPNAIRSRTPDVTAGDFASPEQIIPPEGVTDVEGRPVPWEACITMNNNWGFNAFDTALKAPKAVVRKLVECVAKNGNLLLNVGPDARGLIPESSLRVLEGVGAWMRANGDSIYGCGRAERPKPEWGWYTSRGNRLFAHVFDGNFGALALPGLAGKIRKVRLLASRSEIKPITCWNTEAYPEHAFINFGPVDTNTYPLPDDTDTVVEIELDS